ncbi:cytochrome c oxidase assembly factor 3, mitochondrial [Pseudomyrmex gracilis]|uniref:cytochrome c oxidase assembly factor 3, mitochondrial n=1 Tax=Pseudomyrmex gracilis TaxID=219809 RepID=UPI000995C0D1|nr:cytochrome c oxidase assembly factor 3, mitochondrial [Pseudomyrmex gracilis]
MASDSQLQQNETMPKVDVTKDTEKLRPTDIVYMKRLEEQNRQRASRVLRYRRANNITAITLGLTVIGIYSYTIYSVKQEKFLDDFEIPEKVKKE